MLFSLAPDTSKPGKTTYELIRWELNLLVDQGGEIEFAGQPFTFEQPASFVTAQIAVVGNKSRSPDLAIACFDSEPRAPSHSMTYLPAMIMPGS